MRSGYAADMVLAVRWALPAAIFLAGVVGLVIRNGDSTGLELFAMTTGASLSVLLVGWLVRIGNAGEQERRDEEAARDYYAEHGRWPDES